MTSTPSRLLVSGFVLSIILSLPAAARQPVASGSGGAVATISEQASQSALRILNQGGNAVDAAVAAAATLGVTDPFSCGIGGGGFMVVYLAKDKRVITIDHREMAPAATRADRFLEQGKPIDFEEAVASGLSVGVPGTVRGWDEALQRYGSMSFKQVLAPAIEVASKGFPVGPHFAALSGDKLEKFARFSSTRALYLPNGKPIPAGTLFRNPDMAKAYRAIAAGGVKAFYSGPLAKAIVDAVQHPPVVAGKLARAGDMQLADLANYEARIRQPVHTSYRGYDIYGMPLPGSGAITLGLALNLLEGYDLKALPRAQAEHLYIEAARLAFADRNAYLADPEYVDAPVEGLLSKAYAAQRRQAISLQQAAGALSAGDPFAFQKDPSYPLRPASAKRLQAEGMHTTHLVVSDKDGNVVSYTYTIEDWGGSGIVVPGWGFILNNEMTDFDFSAPHPNVPEAGKRPRSSMTPTIAFKDGKPAFAIGSPGGATIITTVLQTMVNYIDLGMDMPAAVAAPRISARNSATPEVEPGFSSSPAGRALEAFGHRWAERPSEIGIVNAIVFNPDGTVTAVAEPKRAGGGTALVQKAGH
ncbi:gamma-glutamyltransferase [Massilia sp. TS11]|uniref:gamma-glutamyltransferase n=1 Tax=Massilia sp. TS11 TaxID=2908003 RepID=UPI001EDB5077|nr:gamma-glutamyltransferase [Massilia sp. TS11]MCG2585346.1 gamma-glutamyltransferase [Massilia sp. TS11]